ncbi:MAG: UPF0175 family protein [Verrucomicrobiota bacterium]|nr:UPF0175 family protein [Verrucomicrobiota bacterium]
MSITFPDELLRSAGLSENDTRAELAVALFQQEKMTLGQASKLAQMNQADFMHVLASRKISLHYGVEDLKEDVQTLQKLGHL